MPQLAPILTADDIAEAVTWRRHLHQHPEVAYQEKQTSDFIASQLTRFGLTVHRGLAGTGVVGTLSRGTSSRVIGIRADMDALPIEEKSTVAYISENAGVMHACGHDGHVAIALAAARACARLPNLDGTVHFIFQPAEENEGGAQRMVEEGLFRLFPCDWIYALHNWPAIPLGTFVARDGPVLAAFATFEIQIAGRGCHGALPHEGNDVILAGSHLVTALQSVTSRNVDPREAAVVSVTQFRAGDTWNTIPDVCTLRGTTRSFDAQVADLLEKRVSELSKTIAAAFACQANVRYERRFPATVNNPTAAAVVREAATKPPLGLSVANVPPSTGSEDFSLLLQEVPGCYLLLGSGRSGQNALLHSPQFDFNDEVLPLGARLWVEIVRHSVGPVGGG